jgi:hypothetical protein
MASKMTLSWASYFFSSASNLRASSACKASICVSVRRIASLTAVV